MSSITDQPQFMNEDSIDEVKGESKVEEAAVEEEDAEVIAEVIAEVDADAEVKVRGDAEVIAEVITTSSDVANYIAAATKTSRAEVNTDTHHMHDSDEDTASIMKYFNDDSSFEPSTMSAERQLEELEGYINHGEDYREFQFRKLHRLMKKLFPATSEDGVFITVRDNILTYQLGGCEPTDVEIK